MSLSSPVDLRSQPTDEIGRALWRRNKTHSRPAQAKFRGIVLQAANGVPETEYGWARSMCLGNPIDVVAAPLFYREQQLSVTYLEWVVRIARCGRFDLDEDTLAIFFETFD